MTYANGGETRNNNHSNHKMHSKQGVSKDLLFGLTTHQHMRLN